MRQVWLLISDVPMMRFLMSFLDGSIHPASCLLNYPSPMEAVRDQKEDLPYDSMNPLFLFGHGLNY